ncbi:TetR family transcriptional regulator C-terminal domain-containing protein [Yinghuangia aomiensis]
MPGGRRTRRRRHPVRRCRGSLRGAGQHPPVLLRHARRHAHRCVPARRAAGRGGGPRRPRPARRPVGAVVHGLRVRARVLRGAAPYSWHLRVEAWRWAQRDPVWRAEVLADAADWRKIIAEAVAEGVAAGRFRADADPDQVALQALAMSGGIGLAAALPDPAVTAERAHRLLVDMLARLLGPTGAPAAPDS